MASQRLSDAAVTKLMSDCEDAGGEVYEVSFQEYEFGGEYGCTFRTKYKNGKPVSLKVVVDAFGNAVKPPIPVTVAKARALAEL
jgi:hypothetical protein